MHPYGSIHTEYENSSDSKMRTVILWFLNWLILWEFWWYFSNVSWQRMMVCNQSSVPFSDPWHQPVSPATRKASTLRWDRLCLCAKPCCWQRDISLPPSAHCVDKKQTHGKLAGESKQSLALSWCQNKHLSLLFLDDNIYKHTNSNCLIKWFLSS